MKERDSRCETRESARLVAIEERKPVMKGSMREETVWVSLEEAAIGLMDEGTLVAAPLLMLMVVLLLMLV